MLENEKRRSFEKFRFAASIQCCSLVFNLGREQMFRET